MKSVKQKFVELKLFGRQQLCADCREGVRHNQRDFLVPRKKSIHWPFPMILFLSQVTTIHNSG
jgi:hypothetical protein